MAKFLQDDHTFIVEQSLDNCLDPLRDSLRKAEQSYRLSSTSDDGAGDQGPLKAVLRLLYILQGHNVGIKTLTTNSTAYLHYLLSRKHQILISGTLVSIL